MEDKGIQTFYREELTQTDPYSPPEIVTENTNMELLKIKHFKYGKELPPTIDELLLIEDLRERAAFEGALPPLSDEACFLLRRKLMQRQEIRDWEKRENEIKRVHSNKLNLLKNILVEREKETDKKLTNKLEKMKSLKNKSKNQMIAKIQKRKKKILRKLILIQKNFTQIKKEKDIISDYNNYNSKIYANITREGISLEKLSEKFKKEPLALTNYELYKELLSSLKPTHVEVEISLDELLNASKRKYFKLEKTHLAQLKKAQADLWGNQNKKKKNSYSGKYDLNIQNVVPRPDTPYFDKRTELVDYPHQMINLDKSKMAEAENKIKAKEQKHRAAILIQKLLRGRAIQNSMFDGKEKRLALIEELLIVANIDKLEKKEEDAIISLIKETKTDESVIKKVIGRLIANISDHLSKEFIRFQDKKEIDGFVKKANSERINREAVETGRRQAEKIIKNREKQLYSEILTVHRNYVADFLDDLVDYSSSFLTKKVAMQQTDSKKIKFQNYIEENNEDLDLLINDFMHLFLIPNIDRQKLRKRIKIEEKKISQIVKEKTTKEYR